MNQLNLIKIIIILYIKTVIYFQASKRRSSAKGRSEVSDDEGDKKDKLSI